MANEISSDNYVVIQGWMCNELGLKGNELLIFALIYGFSQDGNTRFYGSRSYIGNTFNISLPTVDKAISSLVDKNLIEVTGCVDVNMVQHNEYNVNYDQLNYFRGVVKKLYRGSKETLLNNTNNTNKNKTISKDIVFTLGSKKSKTVKKPTLWDKCVSLIDNFTTDTVLKEHLIQALQLFIDNSKEAGTPFYTNNFKGKLNTLKKLTSNIYEQDKIVVQTLDNGWNNFYALKINKQDQNVHNRLNESGELHVPHIERDVKEDLSGYEKY